MSTDAMTESAEGEQARVKRLGHLVIRVRDLERSERFYTDVLGLRVTARMGGAMSFLSAREDASHELALLALGANAPGPDPRRVGLYHFAFQVDSLAALDAFQAQLVQRSIPFGVGDHGISLGVYFVDPDGNEIEVFYELPKDKWPNPETPFVGRFPRHLAMGAQGPP